MSTARGIPPMDIGRIARFFGSVMYSRGAAYAAEGRVLETAGAWHADHFTLSATVRGSGASRYHVSIDIGQFGDINSSYCTCPVAMGCKHGAAAALVVAQAGHVDSGDGADDGEVAAGGRRTPDAAGTGPDESRAAEALSCVREWAADKGYSLGAANDLAPGAPATAPDRGRSGRSTVGGAARRSHDWRQELGALRWTEPDSALVPLAIRFELEGRAPASWYARKQATPPTAQEAAAEPELRVSLRVLRPGKRENWIKGGLSWRSMLYPSQVSEYQRAQVDVLARIYRVFTSEHEGYGSNGETIGLEQFGTGLVWTLLAEARAAGVTFLAQSPLADVAEGGAGSAGIDITDDGDAIVVAPLVSSGPELAGDPGEALASPEGEGRLHLIGRTAIGRLLPVGERGNALALTFHPLSSPLPAAVRALLLGDPIRIDHEDSAEFFADFYPRMLDQTPVTSSDDSVDLPAPERPRLLLALTYARGDRLTLDWSWRYPGARDAPFDYAEGHGRERAFEAEAVASVRQIAGWLAVSPQQTLADIDTAEFTHAILPRIERLEYIEVEIHGDRPTYVELTARPHIKVTADAVDKRDWLDLGFEITIEGRTIPFPELFKALSKGAKKLKLPDNSFFSLDHPAFDSLKAMLDEADALGEWDPRAPKLGKRDVALWEELADLADEADADEQWLESVSGLRSLAALPRVEVPAELDAELRDYQRTGFEWLSFLCDNGLGGVLADDMGLGKTLQTLALIVRARSRGQGPPFLVVAPSSVVGVWHSEAARFAPGLAVTVIDTTAKKSRTSVRDRAEGADLVITSYTIMRIDQGEFADCDWSGLVMDEAQFVKNRSAQVHQAAAKVPAPFKLAITGTPMENSLTDLWALLDITVPGLLQSAQRFRQHYVRPIESGENPQRMDTLRKRVRPFMLRRTKEQVAADLPEKQEQVAMVDLAPAHRKLYDAVLQRERKKVLGLVDDLDRNRFIVFRSLTLLRMLALDPAIVDAVEYGEVPSSKLDELMERLTQVIEEGHRVLVFSQFTSFLHRVADSLSAAGTEYAYLDGSTRGRGAVIEGFRAGTQPVFLISLKAGGFGVTLTEADYVFLLDPWWNPAAESQAIDRAHRIGQDKQVMVYRMVAAGTIEEKVLALQRKKAELFSSLVDNETAFSSEVTAEDIRGLFAAD